MNILRMIITIALLPILAQLSFGQEKLRKWEEDSSLLKYPQFIRVEFARRLPELNEDPADVNKPFTQGRKVYFRLIMTNTSAEPIDSLLNNPYFHNRLELTKDGRIVPYRKDIAEIVAADNEFDRHPKFIQLKPNEPTYVSVIDLSDWYEPLSLGKYQLRDRFRFVQSGEWVETPVVMFEVDEGPVIYDERTNRIDKLNQAQRKAFSVALNALIKDIRIPEKKLEAYDIEFMEDAETLIVYFHSRSRRRYFETKSCEDFKNQTEVVGWDAYYRLRKSDYSFLVTVFGPPC